ncbi:MAG: diguanylate cyclase [Candidatus Polarisedimenticolaceae bacterium]|nr:diguanylate cyclase [Candidatus Polarisedimenticolaceae bacterium]
MSKKRLSTGVLPISNVMTAAFFAHFPEGVVVSDQEGKVLFFNKECERIFGYSEGEISGCNISKLVPPELWESHSAVFERLLQKKQKTAYGNKIELKVVNKAGQNLTIEWSYHLLQEGENTYLFSLIEDISERVALQAQLYKQTITDALTNLHNRRYFDERLKQEFIRSSRYNRNFSIIIIDVDGFKQANDLYGHSFGDKMLVKAGKIFLDVLRDGDNVYRYGGDEFAVILPETVKEGAVELAERLRRVFARECCCSDKRLKLTLSIGVAGYPEDGPDEVELIATADSRMYHSKENGGNMTTAYRPHDDLGGEEEIMLRSLNNLVHIMEKKVGRKTLSGVSHSTEIRSIGTEIGRKINLSVDQLDLFEQSAMLHDIGILYVAGDVMKKSGKLTPEEHEEVRKHVVVGERLLTLLVSGREDLKRLPAIVGQHHEWFDGTGYPRGLKGEEILIEARILAVTDSYSAMRSERNHRQAKTAGETLNEIQRLSGKQFDPQVVEALLKVVSC